MIFLNEYLSIQAAAAQAAVSSASALAKQQQLSSVGAADAAQQKRRVTVTIEVPSAAELDAVSGGRGVLFDMVGGHEVRFFFINILYD